MTEGATPRRYPGPRQILSYLRIEHEFVSESQARGRMPVLPDLLHVDGRVRLGAVAPFPDVLAGVLANRVVGDDWVATSSFELHLDLPPASGFVHGVAQVLRAGKNTVVTECRLADDAGRACGRSVVTYTRLPRRADTPAAPGDRPVGEVVSFATDDEEPRLPLDTYLGLTLHPDSPRVDFDHHERIHNSFGSIQGGAMAAILERTAMWGAEQHWPAGTAVRCHSLAFSYLAQARVGPFVAEAHPDRVSDTSYTARVELNDAGQDARTAAVGTAVVEPV